MVNSVVDLTLSKSRSRWAFLKQLSTLWLSVVGVGIVSLAVTAFIMWPRSPLDLGVGHRLLTSGAVEAWRNGDLVVLVRHEERCDRSTNTCLGPADGLTTLGSLSATATGKAFQALGMQNTDVLSSPTTRTAQTSLFMFGKSELALGPLAICGPAIAEELRPHKQPDRNLLVVTHSACISDFEETLGFKHAAHAEYGSALFVKLLPNGKFKALGIMNSKDWAAALKQL
ncbi:MULTISPECIES: histidine phosphatase family protein [unclassified Pseudomonas]|uniref:lipopolysaccharide core heptose(II)-phosphate phosphatase PmrG n=1 Tax=unclassified Pseudomonas TaxID=196821 RepID=UPI0015A10455|nr:MULTISPECIES: histidine phosphatase family protein [unclassified Pseudomonas]NWC96746.1 histidine phosphatase family protein [Pseudomonas sp. IPO3779]NWD21563.1 histidine phosphatase family protein [Pseudomonas sp. IPO3778]